MTVLQTKNKKNRIWTNPLQRRVDPAGMKGKKVVRNRKVFYSNDIS